MNAVKSSHRPLRPAAGAAFTLVEVLTVLAIVAVLAAILVPVVHSVQHQARVSQSTATIRALGAASLLYANDHDGKWPRSSHSPAPGERNWWVSLSGYLWPITITSKYDPRFAEFKAARLRDPLTEPEDEKTNLYNYGLNVHLQLDPDFDDYTGSPSIWHTLSQVPAPNRTVLFATSDLESSDHFMAHFWGTKGDAQHDLATRDEDKAAIVFCDGHVEWLLPSGTYDPAQGIDHWNPMLAAR